jgi:glycine hydroxymethyltransferase
MGAPEVTEIADVITTILSAVTPAGDSKAKFDLDGAVVDTARRRVSDLLARHPLYPEIDLDALSR